MHDPALIEPHRLIPGAFTRQRKLPLPRVLAMMVGGMCASVQTELDTLFAQLHHSTVRVRGASRQAFAKLRGGLAATVFDALNAHLLALALPVIDAQRWHGLRVVAGDGSRLSVSTRRGADLLPDHYAFALFLPGAELTLHASLHAADGSERQMLFEALDHTGFDDLLVLDRGFPGNAMVATLAQRQRAFCMRVDKGAGGWACVETFLRSGRPEAIVELAAPSTADATTYEIERTPTRVRLIRDVTPAGSVRVLMTSLLDGAAFPAAAFGALYHRRWRVEEAFKRIKHRLRLEAATGLTHLAFQQDFAAKIVADNLHVLLAAAHDEATTGTDVVAASRPNRTYALGALKPILAGCLLGLRPCLRDLRAALDAIVRTRCRIQTGRSYPRPPRAKPHVYAAYRAVS